MGSTTKASPIELCWMGCMSASFVPVAQPVVLVTGGGLIIIWDQLFLCKLIGGLLTVEMNIPMKDWLI